MKKISLLVIFLSVLFFGIYYSNKVNLNFLHTTGEAIDSLNHVQVYFNGGVNHVEGRTIIDGYNVGLKYQCVEFVKRYYLEFYKHKMPDSYGHAKSFFQRQLKDGAINKQRNLLQFSNPSRNIPEVGDLLVLDGSVFNQYGHVAIISNVSGNEIEIIQQNPGPFSSSRASFNLMDIDGKYQIESNRILGWLRKQELK